MGLHDSLLDVPERLRVWQQAGIRYFYIEDQPDDAGSDTSPEAQPRPSALPDPAAWPAPWPAIFAKAPPRPRIVITYHELGLDMTGQADPRRGTLWRHLIQSLGLTGQNAVAFWPLCLPDSPDPARDTAIFLAGLAHLQPVVLAVFGPAEAGLLDCCRRDQPALRVVSLAAPHILINGDTEAINHALSVLGGR